MKKRKLSGERVSASCFFGWAKSKASEYAGNSGKLNRLLDEATKKAERGRRGPLEDVWESLTACFRLLRAYARREYTEISWQSLITIIAAVVYFVMPVDLIPDFILGLGFFDDAALLAWAFKVANNEIDQFRAWEQRQSSGA
jgi:uncharacterized membrane protein YkvA (DUF1232 family)